MNNRSARFVAGSISRRVPEDPFAFRSGEVKEMLSVFANSLLLRPKEWAQIIAR